MFQGRSGTRCPRGETARGQNLAKRYQTLLACLGLCIQRIDQSLQMHMDPGSGSAAVVGQSSVPGRDVRKSSGDCPGWYRRPCCVGAASGAVVGAASEVVAWARARAISSLGRKGLSIKSVAPESSASERCSSLSSSSVSTTTGVSRILRLSDWRIRCSRLKSDPSPGPLKS